MKETLSAINDAKAENQQQPYAAWIGLDWADQKHFWSMRTADGKLQRGQLDNTPESIKLWASELVLLCYKILIRREIIVTVG